MAPVIRLNTFSIAVGMVIAAVVSSRLPAQQVPTAFEVASIRQHEGPLSRMKVLNTSGPRITMEGYSIFLLIQEAYDLKGNYQISLAAVPRQQEEIRGVYYNIVARAPGDKIPTRDEVRQMLQNLLAERFKLAVHRETKAMPVYALIADNNGPRMKESAADGECSYRVGLASDGPNYLTTFSSCTIGSLAEHLGNLGIDRPVLDKTGLSGKYDFRLVVTPEWRSRDQADLGVITAFTAVRELGFKLDPQRGSIEIVAVDKVGKPTEN